MLYQLSYASSWDKPALLGRMYPSDPLLIPGTILKGTIRVIPSATGSAGQVFPVFSTATKTGKDLPEIEISNLLLIAFYSTAQVDKRKAGQLASAIQVAFQQLGAYPSDPSRLPPAEQAAVLSLPTSPRQATDALEDLRRELERVMAPEISRDQVGIRAVHDGLVISLREGGFFDSGVAEVKASSQPALSRMASVLAEGQYNLRVEGHTDNVRIHNAQFKSNWELSTARSTEMVRLLIMTYGFAPQRLSASGYAEFHPIASNNTAADRALNRRVDVVVLADHAPAPAFGDTLVSGVKP